MKRWWFTDDSKNPEKGDCSSISVQSVANRKWSFRVVVNHELDPREIVAVSGSCDSLGNWNSSQVLQLKQNNDKTWSNSCLLPNKKIINYRYIICAVEPKSLNLSVRFWETHLEPRKIIINCALQESFDTFGDINGLKKIDRGWLTTETIFQFKLFNNPFIFKQKLENRKVYFKITPMNLRINEQAEDSLSDDARDSIIDQLSYSFVEVAKLNSYTSSFQPQKQFGEIYNTDDYILFTISVHEPKNTAFLIDLYTLRTTDKLTHHLGYHYILPNILTNADGKLELTIACGLKHRPVGMMKIEYLKITPFKWDKFNTKVSFIRHWNNKFTGLDVGHRGSGCSFVQSELENIRENTIASFKKAALHGADMIEFDVQLSQDLVPVIYHDFEVFVSLKPKKNLEPFDMLELPLNKLNLDQLQNLKVYHKVEGNSRKARFFDEDLEEHQPFPTLAEIFDRINRHVGFNIEIKWAMQLKDGSMDHQFQLIDKNLYIDCILKVVLSKAYDRRVVFSCFDPDICTMLRYKQNIYPVMFLTIGVTEKYPSYYDPRCNTISKAIEYAVSMELLGIVAHTEDLLRDPSQIKAAIDRGLVMFCWGADNNSKETIKYLKGLGIHAIIYDKMHVFSTKAVKQSVFFVEKEKELQKYAIFKEIDMQNQQDTVGDKCFSNHAVLDTRDAKERDAVVANISAITR